MILFSETISTSGQWAHSNIHYENACNFTIENNNVRVGIIDTEVTSHLDLKANISTDLDFVNMVDNEPGT